MNLAEIFAAQQIGFPILSTLIFLPIALAILVNFLKTDHLARWVALLGALAVLVLALVMTCAFIPGVSHLQFAERIGWISTVGITYHIGVDGISVLFVPLTAFLSVVVILVSWNSVRFLVKPYLAAVLAFEAMVIGVFVTLDLFVFFIFWELMLVPSYFLIKLWGGGPDRQRAGTKYVMYMLSGSAPMLIGIILLGVNYNNVTGGSGATPSYSFDFPTLLSVPIAPGLQTLIFFLLAFGFAVKGPLFPFHTWMPTTLLEGPAGMGVFLVGIKLGVYGFIRFVIPLLPIASARWLWLMVVLGVFASLYGALIAMAQPNLRRLLAFASISHVGLAILGLFSLNQQGIQGGIIMIINLGFVSAGLFMLAAILHERVGSSELSAFGGLARQAPLLGTFFFLFGMAVIGLPITSGFTGEFLILQGAFLLHPAPASVAVLGVVLSAAYLLVYYERAFFGPVTRSIVKTLPDLRSREAVVAAALFLPILWIGVYPAPLLHVTGASVQAVVERVKDAPLTAFRLSKEK
ncbi:MAG: NADH-quinone oxidoreductase subunit M [Chthoniobacterales bacterium]|nr:NADH-quinone oxidoreductase subunit M [Chthoniobacterales bacterium]